MTPDISDAAPITTNFDDQDGDFMTMTADNAESRESRLSRRGFMRWLAAGGLIAGGAYTWFSHRLDVTSLRYDLRLGQGRGIRVAAFSDLHLQGTPEDYAPLLRQVRASAPDLVVIVGDTVDHAAGCELISILKEIEAPLGKLCVLGNWDRSRRIDLGILQSCLENADVRLLVNETVDVAGLKLVGVDDWIYGSPETEKITAAAATQPTLALTHCPIVFDAVTTANQRLSETAPCLVLAGHTHGGQIAPFGVAPYTPYGSGRYVAGWYSEAKADMYVMRGIGFSDLNLRVGSRPELTLIDLV